uniref:Serologically defined colon cancer antigen 8 homolog n=1 Tax=Phallusia mammillata TaxID=59560 RepID=A0A6F9DR46_9ASCI|nr:serologically defined colon cancer antigen 8 homolog [Phallusia mammillata]
MDFQKIKPKPEHRSNDPLEKIFQLISHQSEYIDNLENENKTIGLELQNLKQRLTQVVDENQAVHDSIRSDVIAKTLLESNNITGMTSLAQSNDENEMMLPKLSPERKSRQPNEKENTMKTELEQVQALYMAKISGLESHIKTLEKNLKDAYDQNEALNKCDSKRKDILVKSNNSVTTPMLHATSLIERVTSERNELQKTVSSQHAHIQRIQEQETLLRQDLQKSLGALEDLQLQKTEILVEKQQLQKDLEAAHIKLDEEITEGHKRILDVAFQQQQQVSAELDDNQRKIGELLATCSHYEDVIEKCGREKEKLSLQLDESRSQILAAEKDLSKLQMEVQGEVKTAIKGYTSAEQELREARNKLEQQLTKSKQELTRCEQHNMDLEKRLSESEHLTLNLQETNVHLCQQLNNSLAEVNAVRRETNKTSQALTEKYDDLKKKLTGQIEELQQTLQTNEINYSEQLSTVEDVSAKQAQLIKKLRIECKSLSGELVNLTTKYREEIGSLAQKNEQLTIQMQRLTVKNKELSEQCVQHGMTHRMMQERLCCLNSRAYLSLNQVSELLDKQAQLGKNKEVLSQEVRFL